MPATMPATMPAMMPAMMLAITATSPPSPTGQARRPSPIPDPPPRTRRPAARRPVATDSSTALRRPGPRWFVSNLARVLLDARESGGQLDVVEMTGLRGDMPPLHVHRREDEYFVVLEGELTVHTPDGSRPVGAGEAAFAPKGVPHAYRVESERARWLALSVPGGFASFVLAASDPAEAEELPPADRPIDFVQLDAAAEEHGIDLLGPPGTLP